MARRAHNMTAHEVAEMDHRAHVEDFCHDIAEVDGLFSCSCTRDHETRRECEDLCLTNYLESEVAND